MAVSHAFQVCLSAVLPAAPHNHLVVVLSGGGTCTDSSTCTCFKGWSGSDCGTSIVNYCPDPTSGFYPTLNVANAVVTQTTNGQVSLVLRQLGEVALLVFPTCAVGGSHPLCLVQPWILSELWFRDTHVSEFHLGELVHPRRVVGLHCCLHSN